MRDRDVEPRGLPEAGGAAGVPVGGSTPAGRPQVSTEQATGEPVVALLERVRSVERVRVFIGMADTFLEAQGFTEHGERHASFVGSTAFNVLTALGHDQHAAELAAVAGYLHDIGNVVTRDHHSQMSAMIAYDVLRELGLPWEDVAHVMAAVGNHEEAYGVSVSAISAAVILADKSDVHRTRVRKDAQLHMDIHDRVNYAVEASALRVDAEAGTLTLELAIDTTISQVLEYFEIFLERMIMCRRAAATLGCAFKITVNGVHIL